MKSENIDGYLGKSRKLEDNNAGLEKIDKIIIFSFALLFVIILFFILAGEDKKNKYGLGVSKVMSGNTAGIKQNNNIYKKTKNKESKTTSSDKIINTSVKDGVQSYSKTKIKDVNKGNYVNIKESERTDVVKKTERLLGMSPKEKFESGLRR